MADTDTPARAGGATRTLIRFGLRVQKLELQLQYEGFAVVPLLQAGVRDYDMLVHVHPESMLLTATLGNVQVEDCRLDEASPYRQICGLRADTDTSLVNMEFRCACRVLRRASILRQMFCCTLASLRHIQHAASQHFVAVEPPQADSAFTHPLAPCELLACHPKALHGAQDARGQAVLPRAAGA